MRRIFALASVLFFIFMSSFAFAGGAYSYSFPPKGDFLHPDGLTVIGLPKKYTVQEDDTLLDIARNHDLGFNELGDLYPEIDPWIPPFGMSLVIPAQWILPDVRVDGIVINIPEMRLYYFIKGIHMVRTYPIGIGRKGWRTPVGSFTIASKRKNPTWYVPVSLQEKYQMKTMPPGPDNPLGDYILKLNGGDYGIHGTNLPWAVGRLVTHGCIRLYPEDIESLFQTVNVGTPVKIVYQPVKFGVASGRIYVEVHRDIYHQIENFSELGLHLLKEKGLIERVDMSKFEAAIAQQNGLPVDITLVKDEPLIFHN